MTSTASSAGKSPGAQPGISILLVDDEVRNLDVLESILASPDYHLVRAQTAQQALMMLLEGDFAAIVLDIQMPETNGIELANLIKQRRRTQHIPIIFLTAYYQEDKDILQGYEVGAVDYLTKPVDPRIIKSKIGVFVELFRKTRELARLNQTLENEVSQRQNAEKALQQINNELEARVKERTAELTHANRAKDDFLAALSHELRTPLNPVLLLASESAGDDSLPLSVRERFGNIGKYVALEARLIDDLLDLTRIIHGKLLLEKQMVDVHDLLRDALATVRESARDKRIAIRTHLAASQSTLFADPVRVQQVFWNVLKNAVKFTQDGGEIAVETHNHQAGGDHDPNSPAGSVLVIKVADSGLGLAPEEIGQVFSAFAQGGHVRNHSSHRFGGLGLGLTISRTLVELHAGTIKAESPGRNKGATFTVELPIAHPAARPQLVPGARPQPETAGVQQSASEKSGLRILLVEDHQPTRDALVPLLVRRKHTVTSAGTVQEARQKASTGQFDLVLSDIGLPDGDGYELMSELRERYGLRGVAMTGYGTEQDVAKARESGFVSHLTKPVRMESLEQALGAAICA
jgi:signal transduction histidine kinase